MKDFDDIDAMDELVGIERRLRGLAWATMLAADYEEKTPAGCGRRLVSYVLHDDADAMRPEGDLYSFFGHGFRNFPHGCGYDIRYRGKGGKWQTATPTPTSTGGNAPTW